MTTLLHTELDAAVRAVKLAATACQAVAANLVTTDTLSKKDRSPVTVADFASQAIVCALLSETLGEVAIVGEESAGALRQPDQQSTRRKVVEHVRAALDRDASEEQILAWIDRGSAAGDSGRYWTLDPIDGTKGFLRKEQYAIALALIEDGQVVLGVLGCPNLPVRGESGQTGVLLTAMRGAGASIQPLDRDENPSLIHVSGMTNPADARFCESVESAHSSHSDAARVALRLGITAQPLRMDSQAKYAAVARGDASIYLRLPTSADYRENIWDHAAGMIVVEEAGGKVTDIDGKPLDFTHGRRLEVNRGIIATNGAIHDAVVEAVRN